MRPFYTVESVKFIVEWKLYGDKKSGYQSRFYNIEVR
jgi:hypothetical protein